MPAHWSHGNPIDILGDANASTYQKALDILIKDKTIDGVLCILTPQSMTDPNAVAKVLVDISKQTHKPILASWMGEQSVAAARDILEIGNIPNYRYPEEAVAVYLKMVAYTQNIQLLYETPLAISEKFNFQKSYKLES